MINPVALGISNVIRRDLKIEYVATLALKPNEYNPNVHSVKSFDLLIKSLSLFGFTQPIVARKGTNVIIDGEHRWRAASILDYEYVPVTFIELTDEEMRIATIIHNKARGHEDIELVTKIDSFLKARNIDLKTTLLSNHE